MPHNSFIRQRLYHSDGCAW